MKDAGLTAYAKTSGGMSPLSPGRVRLERLRLPQPFAGRQGDHRHELERTPLLRVEGGQDRRLQQKKKRHPKTGTHCSILACRQPSPGSPPQCPIVRRLSQPRSPIRHLRTNWLGQRSVRSARARTRVPTPGSSREKLKPSRRSDDETGRAQDRPSLRRLYARLN